jgi:hypothetical protein
VSGNPAGHAVIGKRVSELFDAMAADFQEPLGGIERSLLLQAAKLLVRSERAKDGDIAVRCANAARRILAGLRSRGASQVPGTPPWSPLRSSLAKAAEPIDG